MKRKREKGFWEKRSEKFSIGPDARSRASALRQVEHVSHVTMDKVGEDYVVAYSVAKWYLEELKQNGMKL